MNKNDAVFGPMPCPLVSATVVCYWPDCECAMVDVIETKKCTGEIEVSDKQYPDVASRTLDEKTDMNAAIFNQAERASQGLDKSDPNFERDESSDAAETREDAANVLFEKNHGGLSFRALRSANLARSPLFPPNHDGEFSSRNWSLNDWYTATSGELGEAGNILKKIRRGDMTLHEAKPKLAQEIADVLIYLDLLAAEAGISLDDAVIETFNAKSKQLELPLFLTDNGYVREARECPFSPESR